MMSSRRAALAPERITGTSIFVAIPGWPVSTASDTRYATHARVQRDRCQPRLGGESPQNTAKAPLKRHRLRHFGHGAFHINRPVTSCLLNSLIFNRFLTGGWVSRDSSSSLCDIGGQKRAFLSHVSRLGHDGSWPISSWPRSWPVLLIPYVPDSYSFSGHDGHDKQQNTNAAASSRSSKIRITPGWSHGHMATEVQCT